MATVNMEQPSSGGVAGLVVEEEKSSLPPSGGPLAEALQAGHLPRNKDQVGSVTGQGRLPASESGPIISPIVASAQGVLIDGGDNDDPPAAEALVWQPPQEQRTMRLREHVVWAVVAVLVAVVAGAVVLAVLLQGGNNDKQDNPSEPGDSFAATKAPTDVTTTQTAAPSDMLTIQSHLRTPPPKSTPPVTAEPTSSPSPPYCQDQRGHTCVAHPGPAWSTFFAISPDSSCSGAFRNLGPSLLVNVTAPLGSCSCSCNGVATGTCGTALRGNHFQPRCADDPVAVNAWNVGVCLFDGLFSPLVVSGVSGIAAPVEEESCPSGTVSSLLPQAVDETIVLCGASDADVVGTCPRRDQHCVSLPQLPLQPGLCVRRDGDVLCPTDFPSKTLLHTSFTDGRSCNSECTCRVSGGSCSSRYGLFSSHTCSGSPFSLNTLVSGEELCLTPPSGSRQYSEQLSVDYNAGACLPPADTRPSGDFIFSGPITVCCQIP